MATPLNSTVLKAFDALDLFSSERPEITASVAAAELGMSNATAHRFLTTLEAAGVLVATRRGIYAPGPRLARLGQVADELNPLSGQLQATLDGIRREVNESVMACRLSARGPICVAVSAVSRPISVRIEIGTTLPMLTTAQGKLWLAHMSGPELAAWKRNQAIGDAELDGIAGELAQIRQNGYGENLGGNEPDIGAIAVPVLASDGRAVLTLSVFGMLSRFDADLMRRAEASLKAAALRLGR